MNYTDPPTPAILIAHSRSGSTFLSHCLDSHPQICCERGGPFNPAHGWLKTGISHRNLARALWSRQGCRVSMFRITQRQFKNGYVTLDTLREFKPKVVYLSRRNILQAFVSSELAMATTKGESTHPLHSYEPVKQQELTLDCDTLIDRLENYEQRTTKALETLAGLKVLQLAYEDIISPDHSGLAESVVGLITDFLEVDRFLMTSELKKVNTQPDILNWVDIGFKVLSKKTNLDKFTTDFILRRITP